jgi:hypothetical protein
MVIGILIKRILNIEGTSAGNAHKHVSTPSNKEGEPRILHSHGIRKSRLPNRNGNFRIYE